MELEKTFQKNSKQLTKKSNNQNKNTNQTKGKQRLQGDKMSINWEKGFSRAWLVFAVIWWFVGLVSFLINAAVVFHLTDDIRNFKD